MNMLDHYLVQSYTWNNRHPRRIIDGEFDLNTWDYAEQNKQSGLAQYFHPGMISVMLALIVLAVAL
ncbi:MAG: hypothetical protein IT298_11895 [Chloroflexi bacterium]|jgi:hypothetical protein|nr:MAG: hypothetical protein UZ13_00082 [Chloroflexi bacterium OLB13]MBC6954868.1 hypothetical protein [Chloroflexota bacterium]MBV6437154.1 hypothetical protein [Anaerolineae bacterium]MDL1915801.1 hypothetical protein [Anaerolineae bacterium CFX4]OQY81016.1 MAG: hypothetical protein B6D42_12015 [Anaerolineae bacterium UTCFX5]